jgi:hypothetical protein
VSARRAPGSAMAPALLVRWAECATVRTVRNVAAPMGTSHVTTSAHFVRLAHVAVARGNVVAATTACTASVPTVARTCRTTQGTAAYVAMCVLAASHVREVVARAEVAEVVAAAEGARRTPLSVARLRWMAIIPYAAPPATRAVTTAIIVCNRAAPPAALAPTVYASRSKSARCAGCPILSPAFGERVGARLRT